VPSPFSKIAANLVSKRDIVTGVLPDIPDRL
jgi:hypothetical protein